MNNEEAEGCGLGIVMLVMLVALIIFTSIFGFAQVIGFIFLMGVLSWLLPWNWGRK